MTGSDRRPVLPVAGLVDRPSRLRLLALAAGIAVGGLLLATGPELLVCAPNSPADLAVLLGQVQRAHVAMLWGSGAVAAVVFGLLICSTGTFRRAHSTAAARLNVTEVLWTLVPVLIMLAMATPAVSAFTDAAPIGQMGSLAPGYRCQWFPGAG